MPIPKTLSYNPKNQTSDFDLFILCKGLNSGKPLEKPCPNCFVIKCNSQDEKDFYFHLSFGLWKAKYFHTYLVGSVIPFLRLSDLKNIIHLQSLEVLKKQNAFLSDIQKVKSLEQLEKKYYQNLSLISDAKRCLMYRYFKK